METYSLSQLSFEAEYIVQILKAIVAKQLEYHSGGCATLDRIPGEI